MFDAEPKVPETEASPNLSKGKDAGRPWRPAVTPPQAPLGRWERPSAEKNHRVRGAVPAVKRLA